MKKVHLVSLEQHCSFFVIQHLCIPLKSMLTKGYEVAIIIKEDCGSSLLIIRIVAWIEDLDSVFLTWLDDSWCNTITTREVSWWL